MKEKSFTTPSMTVAKNSPHGCLSGSCGACRVEVTQGAENLQEAGYIEKNTLEAVVEEYTEKFGYEKDRRKNIKTVVSRQKWKVTSRLILLNNLLSLKKSRNLAYWIVFLIIYYT